MFLWCGTYDIRFRFGLGKLSVVYWIFLVLCVLFRGVYRVNDHDTSEIVVGRFLPITFSSTRIILDKIIMVI